jgi:four helix bundle protein
MNPEELKKRTKEFAHGCVKLAVALPKTTLGKHVEYQLVRCGTSVASNYRATLLAQTKAAFISKISIVIEETDESEFWLEFIIEERLLKKDEVFSLLNEAHELASIFVVSRRTAQKRIDD